MLSRDSNFEASACGVPLPVALERNVHLRLDDRSAAAQDLERALAIEPRNATLKRQLDALKRLRSR
jgi:hypothetical protein